MRSATEGRTKTLSATSAAVLRQIAEGRNYDQILNNYPALTYLDIFEAAREALALIAARDQDYDERLAEIRRAHPRAYEKWAPEEDARLAALAHAGESVDQMAPVLQRQPSAVRSRLIKLRLVQDEAGSDTHSEAEQIRTTHAAIASREDKREQDPGSQPLRKALSENRPPNRGRVL